MQSSSTESGTCLMCCLGTAVSVLIVLFVVKRYFAGGWCSVNRDLSGQVAVITGGNTGIGKETANRLLTQGCEVIIGARDISKNQETVKDLSKLGKITSYRLDLADEDSIVDFVSKVSTQLKGRPLNILVNNAGVMALPELTKTKSGLQMQIGVNHFGHFRLTFLLWQSLKASQTPRIVNVSSLAHKSRRPNFDIDFDNLNYENGGYDSFAAYSHSKKSNILFTKQLQKRMDEANVHGTTISLHPGVVRTELVRYMINNVFKKVVFTLVSPLAYIFMKSATEGAQTTIYGVMQNEDKLKKGEYYADCRHTKLLSKQCQDPEVARKLWEVSEKLLNVKFDL